MIKTPEGDLSVWLITDGRLVSLNLSQQISFTQLLSHLLLPALHCSHGHSGRQGREGDLQHACTWVSGNKSRRHHLRFICCLLPSYVRGMSCLEQQEEQKQVVEEGEEEQRLLVRS